MALPAGVTTATVTVGVPVTHAGAPVKTFVSIEPSAFLVHAETGVPLVDFLEELNIAEGVAGQFTLPHTDQAGFTDENGNAYTNWYYTARVTYTSPSKAKVKAPKIKVFQLTTGQVEVDLDKLPGGAPALPYTAPTAKVDAFNGRTGAVTLLEADLPERLSEGELSATYLDKVSGLSKTQAAETYAPPAPNTLVMAGDSHIAFGGPLDQVGGVTFVYHARGAWSWAAVRLRQRMRLLNNAAVGGRRTDEVLTNLQTEVLAYKPGWVLLQAGTNDIIQGMTVSSIQTNILSFIAQCQANGSRVILTTIPPVTSGTFTPQNMNDADTVNRWIKAMGRNQPSNYGLKHPVYVCDWRTPLLDPNALGGYLPANTRDNIHMTAQGAARAGKVLADFLSPLVPFVDMLPTWNDPNSLLTNQMMTGTTGTLGTGVTGTVAASWFVLPSRGTVTAVASLVPRTDGVAGNWQQVAVSAASTGAGARVVQTTTKTMNPGDKIVARCAFETDVATWNTVSDITLQAVANGTTLVTSVGLRNDGTAPADPAYTDDSQKLVSGVLETWPITIPATGYTNMQITAEFIAQAGTIRFAQFDLVKVS